MGRGHAPLRFLPVAANQSVSVYAKLGLTMLEQKFTNMLTGNRNDLIYLQK